MNKINEKYLNKLDYDMTIYTPADIEIIQTTTQARKYLLQAGFILIHKSLISESEYYIFPNRTGEIRLSNHKSKGGAGKKSVKRSPRLSLIITQPLKLSTIKDVTARTIGHFFISTTRCDDVTPEMIQAGMEELWRYDTDYSDDEKTIVKIFTAMTAAKRLATT